MRYTHKLKKPEGNCNYFLIPNKEECDNAENKLGQLEDIEEELGIDLLTLFKALKDGVWIKEEYSSIIKKYDVRGVFNGGIILISDVCSYPDCDFSEYSCDYGKTWALTKEELER